MQQRFEVDGDLMKIFIERRNGDVFEVLCDAEDIDVVSNFKWSARKCRDRFYVVHSRTDTYIHRLLMPNAKIVDHKNRNPLDNRKNNLRSVTRSQNARNVNSRVTSKTGVLGVYPKGDKYQSFVTIEKKVHYLGLFKTIGEGTMARQEFLDKMGV